MQYRQPRQRRKFWTTIPSLLLKVAFDGQTFTQGGLEQCMQGMGIIWVFTAGYSPSLAAMTLCQYMSWCLSCSYGVPCGTLFSALQASEQAWQPTHLSRSMTIPQFAITASCLVDASPWC